VFFFFFFKIEMCFTRRKLYQVPHGGHVTAQLSQLQLSKFSCATSLDTWGYRIRFV